MSKTFKIQHEDCPMCEKGKMIFSFQDHKDGIFREHFQCNNCRYKEIFILAI
jgi:C4-type Zn-finger protein